MNRPDASAVRKTAREALARRLDRDPDNGQALAGLARLCLDEREPWLALYLVRRAASLLPAAPDIRQVLVQALARCGRLGEAVAEARDLARSCSGNAPGLVQAGRACLGLGELDLAREVLTRALDLEPGLIPARTLLARTLFLRGEYDLAEPLYRRLTEVPSASPQPLLDLSHMALCRGELDEARTLADRAVARRDLPPCRFARGNALFRLGDLAAAARDFSAILERVPAHTSARCFLGLIACLQDGRGEARVALGPVRATFGVGGRNIGVELAHCAGAFYEAAELGRTLELLGPPGAVLDVGANCGNHAVFFALAGARKVTPFEIHPEMIAALKANAARNRVADRLDTRFLGLAVAGRPGRMALAASPTRDLGLTRPEAATLPGALALDAVRLDDLDLEPADLVKLDVEGRTLEVLDGAAGYFARCRPVLLVEIGTPERDAVLARLEEWNYVPKARFPHGPYANFLLAPRERPCPGPARGTGPGSAETG